MYAQMYTVATFSANKLAVIRATVHGNRKLTAESPDRFHKILHNVC